MGDIAEINVDGDDFIVRVVEGYNRRRRYVCSICDHIENYIDKGEKRMVKHVRKEHPKSSWM